MDQNPQAKIGSRQTLKNSPANFDSPYLPQLNPHFAGELPISPSNHPNSEK
jgi:hypothetical protein